MRIELTKDRNAALRLVLKTRSTTRHHPPPCYEITRTGNKLYYSMVFYSRQLEKTVDGLATVFTSGDNNMEIKEI